MLAAIIKLLPFLQLLLEAFKPGDGEKVTRANKITALAIVLLLTYSIFVSYAYVEQFHSFVTLREHVKYTDRENLERGGTIKDQEDELRSLYSRLFECLARRPYDDGNGGSHTTPLPAPVTVPETPVHVKSSNTESKREVASKPVGVLDMSQFRQELLKNLNDGD